MTAQKIDELRRKLASSFYIRGISKRESFSTDKPLESDACSIPAYYVNPLYNIDSKEWLGMLQATIHAASYRALNKSHPYLLLEELEEGKIDEDRLPTLMAFGCIDQNYTRVVNTARGTPFDEKFNHRSERYEQGIVHGMRRQTFREAKLCGGYCDGQLELINKKLFEVSLTKKELRDVHSKLNAQLNKRFGSSLLELLREESQGSWNKAFNLTGHNKTDFTMETSPQNPAIYLLYNPIARILTNKFIRKGLRYVNNLPEVDMSEETRLRTLELIKP